MRLCSVYNSVHPKDISKFMLGKCGVCSGTEFPKVEEHTLIAPAFETFGLPSRGMQLGFITGASHDRFCLSRPDGDELIQFQQDRLLHNWRKVADQTNEYPRFEFMIKRFQGELEQVQSYMSSLSPQCLSINQCEISYINHIAFEADPDTKASDWLRFVIFGDKEPEDFSFSFREIIHDDAGKPRRAADLRIFDWYQTKRTANHRHEIDCSRSSEGP